jgi:hypothetical protein
MIKSKLPPRRTLPRAKGSRSRKGNEEEDINV